MFETPVLPDAKLGFLDSLRTTTLVVVLIIKRIFLFFPFTCDGVSAIILITALFYRNESINYEYCL